MSYGSVFSWPTREGLTSLSTQSRRGCAFVEAREHLMDGCSDTSRKAGAGPASSEFPQGGGCRWRVRESGLSE